MARRSTSQIPRLVRGSVVTHRRRCGKPTCRCAGGVNLHQSTVLSYSEGGRTRFLMLLDDQVAAVRAATDRYRAQKGRSRPKPAWLSWWPNSAPSEGADHDRQRRR